MVRKPSTRDNEPIRLFPQKFLGAQRFCTRPSSLLTEDLAEGLGTRLDNIVSSLRVVMIYA